MYSSSQNHLLIYRRPLQTARHVFPSSPPLHICPMGQKRPQLRLTLLVTAFSAILAAPFAAHLAFKTIRALFFTDRCLLKSTVSFWVVHRYSKPLGILRSRAIFLIFDQYHSKHGSFQDIKTCLRRDSIEHLVCLWQVDRFRRASVRYSATIVGHLWLE